MKKLSFKQCIDLHLGKRIFIFGTGPTLNDVTQEQIRKIEEEEISLAANYAHYAIRPTYWMAGGHATQLVAAVENLHEDTIAFFHHDPGARSLYPNFNRVNYFIDRSADFMSRPLTRRPSDGVVIGGHNILLSVSHLAYVMGASEIIYIGFEQINRLHYYNFWPQKKLEYFKQMFRNLSEKYSHNPEVVEDIHHLLNIDEPDEQRWCHFKPVDVCKSLSFKKEEKNHHNYPIFKNYIEQFKEDGIKVYTTATEGIAVDAGCEVVDLEDILK